MISKGCSTIYQRGLLAIGSFCLIPSWSTWPFSNTPPYIDTPQSKYPPVIKDSNGTWTFADDFAIKTSMQFGDFPLPRLIARGYAKMRSDLFLHTLGPGSTTHDTFRVLEQMRNQTHRTAHSNH